jgi:hypothetical protein
MVNLNLQLRNDIYDKHKYTKPYKLFIKNFYKADKWRSLRNEIFSIYGNTCKKCESIETVQIDHIYPISLFPELRHEITNLQPLCRKCNKSKSNKEFDRYIDVSVFITYPNILKFKEFYKNISKYRPMKKKAKKYRRK